MENNSSVNEVTQRIIDSMKENMINSFEMGMKYKRLEIAESLIRILRENEFTETEISMVLKDAKVLEDRSYADIFAEIDSSDV